MVFSFRVAHTRIQSNTVKYKWRPGLLMIREDETAFFKINLTVHDFKNRVAEMLNCYFFLGGNMLIMLVHGVHSVETPPDGPFLGVYASTTTKFNIHLPEL